MRRCIAGALLGLGSLAANAATLTPQDFAYGMPIIAAEVATAYRLTLPPDVYRASVDQDLGDVRVFNSRGETVPYAIFRRGEPTAAAPAQSLPLFPLRGDRRAAANGLKLTLDSGDGAVQLQTPPRNAEPGPVVEYIVDARRMDTAIASLQLVWPDASADFSGRMRIETSDDFANWRTVATAPVANLHAAGQSLLEDRIDVAAAKAKFWRLIWVGAPPAFELSAIKAAAIQGPPRTHGSTVFINGMPDSSNPGDYRFDLGARLPVERVNLVLPELNAVYAVEFSSRPREQDAWSPVIRAGFYRLSTADGEQRNGDVSVGLHRDRYWQARILGDGARPSPLRLEASWSPADLEFVAQGPPPYQLAYGSSEIHTAETSLAILPAAAIIAPATLGARGPLGGEVRLSDAHATTKRLVLWSVLTIAVVLLGTMAARLSRERKSQR
jgi:hypothetical protein